MDNLARALKRAGRIVVELIPKKYDTAREVRIIGEDQKQRIVKVNQPGIDENGKAYHYKLDFGKFDVQVAQGPSYSTARLETREMIMALAQGNPEVWQIAADIFFENQDFVGADRLAKRFKKALPPALQDADEDDPEIPPQVQAQVAALQQAGQALQQQNAELLLMVKGKMLELQVRADSAERMNREKIESAERMATQGSVVKIQVAETVSKSAAMNKLADIGHAGIQADLDRRAALLHDQITVEADQTADAQQMQADAQQQTLDRAHEASLAAQTIEAEAQQSAQQQKHEQQQQAAQPPPETAPAGKP
jgi:hypothetical protein